VERYLLGKHRSFRLVACNGNVEGPVERAIYRALGPISLLNFHFSTTSGADVVVVHLYFVIILNLFHRSNLTYRTRIYCIQIRVSFSVSLSSLHSVDPYGPAPVYNSSPSSSSSSSSSSCSFICVSSHSGMLILLPPLQPQQAILAVSASPSLASGVVQSSSLEPNS
jgi:hypothetical protein